MNAQRQKVEKLLSKGVSVSEIARRLEIPRPTLASRIERWGMEDGRGGVSSKANTAIKNYRAFAKIWNDHRGFPVLIDLERHYNISLPGVRARATRYTEFRLAHPQHKLEELIWRDNSTGGMVVVPEGVIRQLDEFRIKSSKLKNPKGIVVTSAQFGAPLNNAFWKSLKGYAKYRKFPLVVLPIKYGPVKTVYQEQLQERQLSSTFAEELKGHMIFDDTEVRGIMLSVLRLRPTLEKFLTLPICEIGGAMSHIFAAPRLELEHLPRLGRKHPKAIMTTGAVTHPHYFADNVGQLDRQQEIATRSATFSAIVVEFYGGQYHFRQLLANKRGEFYDIDVKEGGARLFKASGNTHEPDAVDTIVLGDWHTGITSPMVRKCTFEKMVPTLKPSNIILHDFMDTESVNWFDSRSAVRRSYKSEMGWDSLETELTELLDELRWMRSKTDAFIHVVASNHNGFVTTYIERMEWTRSDKNRYIASQLYARNVRELRRLNPIKAEADAPDCVQLWINDAGIKDVMAHGRKYALLLPEKVKHTVLLSMHGDVATGGKDTRSMQSFRKFNHRIMIGHTHSSAILHSVWRVGVSTPLTQTYVTAPATAWTNTHGVIFRNGQRQLLNIIKSRYHG